MAKDKHLVAVEKIVADFFLVVMWFGIWTPFALKCADFTTPWSGVSPELARKKLPPATFCFLVTK